MKFVCLKNQSYILHMSDSEEDSEINSSDSEEEIIEKNIDTEFPEEEIDEDTRMLLYCQALNNEPLVELSEDKENIKKNKIKKNNNNQIKNKNLTLQEFNKKLENERPKKWGSKIMNRIKKNKGVSKERKIKFNPKLSPFKKIYRKNFRQNNRNFNEKFPEL